MLTLFIHIFACIWVGLGLEQDDAWINSDENYKTQLDLHYNAYWTALYFIVVTVTTVGYGDLSPGSNNEFMFVILLELLGLAIFSYILSTLRSIEQGETAAQIVDKKKDQIQVFLNKINEANPEIELPPEIFVDCLRYLDMLYSYEVKYIFDSQEFYDQLMPKVKTKLVFECLKNYYIKFHSFFHDPILKFQAPDKFINDCLIAIEPKVFVAGQTIISRKELMDYIYFIEKGKVVITDQFDTKTIIELSQGDYFGDYQIILETRSNIKYSAHPDNEVVLFALHKDNFLEVSSR